MSLIGSVGYSAAALALLAVPQRAPSFCDPELLRAPKSSMSYQVRGDRCEGIYAQQVSTVNIDLRSFVGDLGSFDPEKQSSLELEWKAPSGIVRDVRLRAFSLKSRIYYRMDTARPADEGSYSWPSDILAGQDLGKDDVGVLAWIELPGPEDTTREVFLPLSAGSPEGTDGYSVTLVPSKKLKKVLITLQQTDEKGAGLRTLLKDKDVGGEFPHFPPDKPTVISTGKLDLRGYYRLEIKAAAASGEVVTKDIDFYHSGD